MNFIKRLLGIPRNFTKDELEELHNFYRLVNGEKFKLMVMKADMTIMPKRRKEHTTILEEQAGIVKLLENKYSDHTRSMLGRLGYPAGVALSFTLKSGKVRMEKILIPRSASKSAPAKLSPVQTAEQKK